MSDRYISAPPTPRGGTERPAAPPTGEITRAALGRPLIEAEVAIRSMALDMACATFSNNQALATHTEFIIARAEAFRKYLETGNTDARNKRVEETT